MLVRSGIDEKRIVSVAGKADRELRNPEDPFAPENRRIDILIELGDQ
jgi:chemotaxis protein MotB